MFLDGFGFGDHTLLGALGVTAHGIRVPLGVAEGSTENGAVAPGGGRLADRELHAEHGVLFVVDGGKALDKAVRAVFGGKALIQGVDGTRNATSPPTPLRPTALLQAGCGPPGRRCASRACAGLRCLDRGGRAGFLGRAFG